MANLWDVELFKTAILMDSLCHCVPKGCLGECLKKHFVNFYLISSETSLESGTKGYFKFPKRYNLLFCVSETVLCV